MQILGTIAGRTGRTTEAIRFLRHAVDLDPSSADVRNELALQLRLDGRIEESIGQCRHAIRLRAGDPGAHNNLGLAYLAEGRLLDAVASFEEAVRLKPDVALIHFHLGYALQLQGRYVEAANAYERAIQLAPALGEAHVRIGQLMLLNGQRERADDHFRRAAATPPATTRGRLQVALALSEAGALDAAEQCLRQAVANDPQAADAYEQLGNLAQQRGEFNDAMLQFEKAIKLRPRQTGAYLAIASARKITDRDRPWLDRMAALLGETDLADQDRARLNYALGKAADDLAQYEKAMGYFDEANRIAADRLRQQGRSIDRKLHTHNIDRLIAAFTREFLNNHARIGEANGQTPIFIVGMIRSGTTLVEQILSSHPDIAAGGELRFWGEQGAIVGRVAEGAPGEAALDRLAADYHRLLRSIAPEASHVTDKMPTNFLLLGLVRLVLPAARVIHCRRHPVDNCLSMYFTPFGHSPDYAHDRDNIAFYYEQYSRLMGHWREVLPPGNFLEIAYEDLIAHREELTRRMVAFCDLEWREECLSPERNERVIKTPSLWQARQPVYSSSIARWHNYEPWLREFRRLLAGDAIGNR
jgi:tetratricopeptide (TPR) repeat protein